MALTAIKLITNSEFNSLEVKLRSEFELRYHYRNAVKRNLKFFCVAWVRPDEPAVADGHLSGKNGMEARFNVRKGKLNPIYTIDPNASGATLVILENAIKYSVSRLYERTLNAKKQERFNAKYWEGYYLIRRKGAPGTTARKNMQNAIDEGVISPGFRNTCLGIGIHMKYCG